jgi:hypothetical protein
VSFDNQAELASTGCLAYGPTGPECKGQFALFVTPGGRARDFPPSMVAISLYHGSKTPWVCGLAPAFARPGVRLEPMIIGVHRSKLSLQRPRPRRIFRWTDPANG